MPEYNIRQLLSEDTHFTEHSSSVLDLILVGYRALKFRISRKSLGKMYISYIHPLLEYSDTVWDNCSLESNKHLESIHTEAARIRGLFKYECK